MKLHLKKKKKYHCKMKFYITSEFISNDISFEKNIPAINYFQSIHNSSVIKSVKFWVK